MGYKMKGSPHKMGSIKGTSSHASAVKSHVSAEKPWEGHGISKEEYKKALGKATSEEQRITPEFGLDGNIIPESIKPKTTISVTGGGKDTYAPLDSDNDGIPDVVDADTKTDPVTIGPKEQKILKKADPIKVAKLTKGLTAEDTKLVNKYQKLTTKRNVTDAKLEEQISKKKEEKIQKFGVKVDKAQERFDKTNEKYTKLTEEYDTIGKLKPKKGSPGDKKLKSLQRKIDRVGRQFQKREDKLDKISDKQWDYEGGGGKQPKGNIFTRMKSNRQDREARRQRTYLNYSDRERWQYRQNKAKAGAELIRRAGGGGGTGELTDWSITPDKKAELTYHPSFNKITEKSKKDIGKFEKQ